MAVIDNPHYDEGIGLPVTLAYTTVAVREADSLIPHLDELDALVIRAEGTEQLGQVREWYAMLEAVAKERRLEEQAVRASHGVTVCRAKLGAITPRVSGRRADLSEDADKLSRAERDERSLNFRLAKLGTERVTEIADGLVADGVRPSPDNVLRTHAKLEELGTMRTNIAADRLRAKGEDITPMGLISESSSGALPMSRRTDNDEWYTPQFITDSARTVMGGIDLDPASNAAAQEWIRAAQYYDLGDDGLEKTWRGRVWINPPYSRGNITAFAEKMCTSYESGFMTQGVWLSNLDTKARWGQRIIAVASAICHWRGSITFIDGSGANRDGKGSFFPKMVLYFGPRTDEFIAEFSQYGVTRAYR